MSAVDELRRLRDKAKKRPKTEACPLCDLFGSCYEVLKIFERHGVNDSKTMLRLICEAVPELAEKFPSLRA